MSFAPLLRKPASTAPSQSVAVSKDAPSLRIGEPNDSFEQEADRVADEVMAGGRAQWSLARTSVGAPLQRKCSCGGSGECEECREKKTIQRKSDGAAKAADAPPIVDDVLRRPGQPLDSESRALLDPRFGYDFSRVRIHTDAEAARSARSVGAKAYTVGNHIAFASSRFAPSTSEGGALLAHELAHVVQQNGAAVALQRAPEDDDDEPELVKSRKRPGPRVISFEPEIMPESKPPRPRPISLSSLDWEDACAPGGCFTEEKVRRREYFEAVDPDLSRKGWEERKKAQQLADWAERGKRAKPTKGAELLMPDEARKAEIEGRNSPPVQHISGKRYQYGMTTGRFKVISPDNYGGGIVEVTNTGFYYNLPEREFNELFGILGISDTVYQDTKGFHAAAGLALKAAGEIANFTQIGRFIGPMVSTAGDVVLHDYRRREAMMKGEQFNEPAPKIGVGTIVQTVSNVVGQHMGGKVEAATGSSLAGTFAGMYSGGAVQNVYEAAKGERSFGSVFAPPSPEDVAIAWVEGKAAGYLHRGLTGRRTSAEGRSEGAPARPDVTRGHENVESKPAPQGGEDAIRSEVEKGASDAGSRLKLSDGTVHGIAAAGEGESAGIDFCSPGCSLAARRLRKAADELSKNPLAKKRNSEVGKLVKYLRDTQQQLEVADGLLRKRRITKKQANSLSAQVAGELRKYAGKYPQLDALLQDDPKIDIKIARDVEGSFVEYRGPAPRQEPPMRPGHARGYHGEQRMGFERYSEQAGWKLITGPGGSAGHETTQKGEDALAYHPKRDRLEIADNKSFAPREDPRQNVVGSATAIDPEKNLRQNLGKMISRVRGMSPFPEKQRVLQLLTATEGALEQGRRIPKNVRLVVTNFGGASTGISERLAKAGVVFEDASD